MARSRTTKGLAKRIALDSSARPSPLRSARAKLSWGAALVAVAVGAAAMVPALSRLVRHRHGDEPAGRLAAAAALAERVLSPGPLSEAHAQFERECARCHGGS